MGSSGYPPKEGPPTHENKVGARQSQDQHSGGWAQPGMASLAPNSRPSMLPLQGYNQLQAQPRRCGQCWGSHVAWLVLQAFVPCPGHQSPHAGPESTGEVLHGAQPGRLEDQISVLSHICARLKGEPAGSCRFWKAGSRVGLHACTLTVIPSVSSQNKASGNASGDRTKGRGGPWPQRIPSPGNAVPSQPVHGPGSAVTLLIEAWRPPSHHPLAEAGPGDQGRPSRDTRRAQGGTSGLVLPGPPWALGLQDHQNGPSRPWAPAVMVVITHEHT